MREQQSRATQERHERLLNELFKVPGNNRCADCTSKNPRWASYSLGVFLCIRCGSLHRKMGTHISKVKSVSMDRWTFEEIQHMKKLGGNAVVNSQVNTNPKRYALPIALDDDHAMERYVRDKWERKLFKEESVTEFLSSSTTDSGLKRQQSQNFIQQAQPPHQRQNSTCTTMSITSLQQVGDSTTSIAITDLYTPSLSSASSSSVISSPTIQSLAGRVVAATSSDSPTTTTTNNPFLVNKINDTSYSSNPFFSSSPSSSFTTTAVTPPPINNNNPFLQMQQQLQLVQSPLDINYNTTAKYFSTSHHQNSCSSTNSHNPFYQ